MYKEYIKQTDIIKSKLFLPGDEDGIENDIPYILTTNKQKMFGKFNDYYLCIIDNNKRLIYKHYFEIYYINYNEKLEKMIQFYDDIVLNNIKDSNIIMQLFHDFISDFLKIKEIITKKGIFLFIEIQSDINDIILNYNEYGTVISSNDTVLYKFDKKYKILTDTKNITSSIAEQIVDSKIVFGELETYKEYNEITWSSYPYESAIDSFNSLLISNFLHINKKYLILQQI